MKKILIIGGGVAGLSAGIYAQKQGYHAVICERHATVGGCLCSWDRCGFHVDNCIHWLTGTNPKGSIYKIWEELGVLGKVEVFKRQYLFVFDNNGEKLGLDRDLRRMENAMLALSPDEKRKIRAFIKAIDTVQGYLGIAGKAHDGRYSGKKLLSRLPNLMKYYRMSLRDLSNTFRNETLRGFFLSFLPENFSALAFIFTAANFCGDSADLPMGGSSAMAKRLVDRFLSLGGEIQTKKEAVKLNERDGKVVSVIFADGEEISADAVVLTIDPARVFGTLTSAPMPGRLRENYNKLERFSAFQCAFSYDGEDFAVKGEKTFHIDALNRDFLRRDYLMLRCDAHEKDYAPNGKTIFQTMIYCDEKECKEFISMRKNDRTAYESLKRELADGVAAALLKQYPELTGKIHLLDVWTPASYERFVNSEVGSFMSFVFPKKKLPLKCPNRVEGLSNVVLAGQWLMLPGGLPIAADTGRDAIRAISEIEKGTG